MTKNLRMKNFRLLSFTTLLCIIVNFCDAQTIPVFIPEKKKTVKPKEVTPPKVISKIKKKEITNGYVEKSVKVANDINHKFNVNYYSGDIENGKANGYGKLYWSGGKDILIFEGYFEENEITSGKYYTLIGMGTDNPIYALEYEGNYKNGLPNGRGKCIFANGDVYEGDFKDCKMNGYGTYYFKGTSEVNSKYIGTFLNNKINGSGQFWWGTGLKYSGTQDEFTKVLNNQLVFFGNFSHSEKIQNALVNKIGLKSRTLSNVMIQVPIALYK